MVEDYVPVYVALIIYQKTDEWEAETPGVFKTEKGAIDGLIDGLVERNFISYADYCDRIGEKDESGVEIKHRTETEFMTFLKSNASTKKELDKVCQEYGDTYYTGSWKFQLVESEVE